VRTNKLLAMLAQNGYTHFRLLGDKYAGLLRFNFTVGLVVGLDWLGHDRRYCYEFAEDAIEGSRRSMRGMARTILAVHGSSARAPGSIC